MLNHRLDRPFWHHALSWAIAAASLALSVWLTGCAQTGITTSHPDAAVFSAPPAAEAQALPPPPPPPAPSDSDLLTALVVRAWPIGTMLQASLDKDPNWPAGGKASQIGPSRLKCLRQQLSPEGYQQSRKAAVDQFIQHHPDQVQDAIDVLQQGGADVMGAAFQAGLKSERTGGDIIKDVAPNFTPTQFGKFMELTQNDKYQPLRRLLFDDSSFPSDEHAGANVGKTFGLQLMRNAMNHCRVPMQDLQ
jgi:hypothetical protein